MTSFRAALAEQIKIPKSTPSSAASSIETDKGIDFRTNKGKKELYILRRRNALAARIVKARANLTLGRGFKIVVESNDQKKALDKFLSRLHPTDPVAVLMVKLRNLFMDADWSGNGWWEKLYWVEDGKRIGLADAIPLHPLITSYARDDNGEIIYDKFNQPVAIEQIKNDEGFGSGSKKIIPIEDAAVLTLDTIGDEILGISIYEPAFKSYHRQMLIFEGVAMGVYRHGMPLHDVTVGNELNKPSQPMLDAAAEEVRGLSYMSEYVHPDWYDVKLIESFSLSGAKSYVDPFNDDIIISSGIPEFILTGKGESANKAVAQEMIRIVNLTIKPLQQIVKLFLEAQIFKPAMELAGVKGIPRVEWNEILPDYPHDPVKKVKMLSEISVGDKPLMTWDELREIAQFPTIEKNTITTLSSDKMGLVLSEGQGELFRDKSKKGVVLNKLFSNMINTPLYIVSGTYTLGIARLRDPKKIDLKGFESLKNFHKMGIEERKLLSDDGKNLWFYSLETVEIFEKPSKTVVPFGDQVFIKNVQFLKDWVEVR